MVYRIAIAGDNTYIRLGEMAKSVWPSGDRAMLYTYVPGVSKRLFTCSDCASRASTHAYSLPTYSSVPSRDNTTCVGAPPTCADPRIWPSAVRTRYTRPFLCDAYSVAPSDDTARP